MNGKFYNKRTTTEYFTRATKHLHKNAQQCPSHALPKRLWTATGSQYFLDTAGQLHIGTTGAAAVCRKPMQTQANPSAVWWRDAETKSPPPLGALGN